MYGNYNLVLWFVNFNTLFAFVCLIVVCNSCICDRFYGIAVEN